MRNFIKSKKKMICIVLLIVLFLLQGCAAKPTNEPQKQAAGNMQNTDFPITVVDYFDREVVISKPVERIACGYAYTGHVVTMLGRGEDIVAVVGGLQRDKVLTALYPHVKDLPVPFGTGAINIEELLASKPDIVFLKTDTALNESEVAKLDKLNIPYVVIDFYSIEEQIESISIIGQVLGAEEKAQQYISYYLKTIEDTKNIADSIPSEERISLYHSVNEAVRTDLKNSLPADWIKITGGINVSIEGDLKISGDKSFAALEQIYLWDPDIIIANEAGVPEYILGNEQWAALRAVKEKKVYQIPNGISRWGHPGSLETPLAILWTAKLLYPKYFEHINMETETKAYYKNFFNMELSDQQVREILSGKGMREAKYNK
ncbi:MAG: ABC transporter substrate-binding protein [Bacillota bacterium]